jgi:hypothetical protein
MVCQNSYQAPLEEVGPVQILVNYVTGTSVDENQRALARAWSETCAYQAEIPTQLAK